MTWILTTGSGDSVVPDLSEHTCALFSTTGSVKVMQDLGERCHGKPWRTPGRREHGRREPALSHCFGQGRVGEELATALAWGHDLGDDAIPIGDEHDLAA